MIKNKTGRRGALRKEVRLSYIRLTASSIASQLYLDFVQVILPSAVMGEYNKTKTEGFNITLS